MDSSISQLELTSKMLDLISEGKLSELEAERLLNAVSRTVAGVATGRSYNSERSLEKPSRDV